MTKTPMSANVERAMVTKPVSFYGNVCRHGNRNRRTPDDTGIITLAVGGDLSRCARILANLIRSKIWKFAEFSISIF